jgi:hypothetical protein
VCPHPCEDGCNRKGKDGAVAVNAMERYVGDFGIAKQLKLAKLTEERFAEKVAIIGAGPAGLSCAYQLARRGYPVTVFEAFSRPGGMLAYGIPRYRLPREVLDVGVELKCNFTIGKDVLLEQLRQEYQAVFVGIGAHKGLKLRVPGGDSPNVFTGTEFLNKANSGEEVQVGGKVLVIVTYAMIINVFFMLMEFFTSMYSHVTELTEDFQTLYLGTLGQSSLLPWGRASLVMMAGALALLVVPATRRNEKTLAIASATVFLSLWMDKGICLVVAGFMPSPLGTISRSVPTLPEIMISVAIWAVGALMITIFYKITLSVREGGETWAEEGTATPLAAVK